MSDLYYQHRILYSDIDLDVSTALIRKAHRSVTPARGLRDGYGPAREGAGTAAAQEMRVAPLASTPLPRGRRRSRPATTRKPLGLRRSRPQRLSLALLRSSPERRSAKSMGSSTWRRSRGERRSSCSCEVISIPFVIMSGLKHKRFEKMVSNKPRNERLVVVLPLMEHPNLSLRLRCYCCPLFALCFPSSVPCPLV